MIYEEINQKTVPIQKDIRMKKQSGFYHRRHQITEEIVFRRSGTVESQRTW